MKHSPHLKKAQELWTAHLRPDDFVIDATCGNGHDTLFLSKLVGHVYAVDIQPQAIENTKKLGLPNVSLHLRSHEEWSWVAEAPRLIVYNLGYLPRSDKLVTTLTKSTLLSLENGMGILAEDGAICVTCYPGHAEGEKEAAAVLEWASKWRCEHYTWLQEKPPFVLFCKKSKNGF